MRHAMRRREPRHAIRARDLQREYRQAVAVQDEVYQQWLDGAATYAGYMAASAATRAIWLEMQPVTVGEYRRPPVVESPPARHSFYDPLSDCEVVLVIGSDGAGVEHGGCDDLAKVSPDLDAAFCTTCRWQARISGAWYLDVVDEAAAP